MVLLYRFSIWIYGCMVRLMAPFYPKAKAFYTGRIGLLSTIENELSEEKKSKIWVHVSSLGEFEQGRPVIEAIKVQFPHSTLVLTFYSPSGYEPMKKWNYTRHIYYLPLDSPSNARRLLEIVKPKAALFIKYDFWYFFLKALTDRGIPTFFISSVFRKDQLLFRTSESFFLPVFRKVTHYFVQDEESEQTLKQYRIGQVTISGDTRYDRVAQRVADPKEVPEVYEFKGGKTLVVFGSVWLSDMAVIEPFLSHISAKAKMLIAPHEVSDKELDHFLKMPVISRFSEGKLNDSQILLLDRIGFLAASYQYADLAIVGGAFRGALHNILEPAAFGVPVLFGDHENNQRFPEVVGLVQAGGAFTFRDGPEFEKIVNYLLEHPEERKLAGERAKQFVDSKTGATTLIMKHLTRYL